MDLQGDSGLKYGEIIASAIEYVADVLGLVDLTRQGAHALVGVQAHGEYPAESEERVSRAREAGVLAERELARGFPLLHSHALVGAWGAVEAAVADVCVESLRLRPALALSEPLSKVKVNAGLLLHMGEAERARYILDEYSNGQRVGGRSGVSQFELRLDAVGLGGLVDPNIKKVLHLAKAMRNVIAHRGGVVDDRFVEVCPDAGFVAGQPLHVSYEQVCSVVLALVHYLEEVNNRVLQREGRDCREVKLPGGRTTQDLLESFGVDR
ncbi:hypothetical protein [Salinibacterium sp. ZJ70]|uniref:hypothetical protein n=1 Tax=Salinibacterium sp. ZJ70 TaxID=2708084 RepID=UPI00141EC31C|nr:hypothetical protein [Salinibacterium sp. ZJ70]